MGDDTAVDATRARRRVILVIVRERSDGKNPRLSGKLELCGTVDWLQKFENKKVTITE